jgi:hypothetical protein
MTNDPRLVTPLDSQSLNLPAGFAAISSQRAYRPAPCKEVGLVGRGSRARATDDANVVNAYAAMVRVSVSIARSCAYRYVAATLLALSCVTASGQQSQPMSFQMHGSGGNCSDCVWVQGSGTIMADTADTFRRFHAEFGRFGCGARVNLNSPGGNLLGGLALGEAFRELGCNTGVATSLRFEDSNDFTEEPGICMSACVYALMGGLHRKAIQEDKIGIHQHYLKAALDFPDAKQFDGRSLSANQVLTGVLVAYTMSMGVDPLVVALAAQVPPHEPIMLLDMESLATLQVINSLWQPARWSLEALDDGLVAGVIQPQEHRAVIAGASFYCAVKDGVQHDVLRFVLPAARHEVPDPAFCESPWNFTLHLTDSHRRLPRQELTLSPIHCAWQRDDNHNWTVSVAVPLSATDQESLGRYDTMSIWWPPMVFKDIWLQSFSLDGFAETVNLARRNCLR